MTDAPERISPQAVKTGHSSPWSTDLSVIVREMKTDTDCGLTSSEARDRLQQFGPNQLLAKPPVPAWKKILAQFQNPLIYLLFGAIVISMVAWMVEGAEGIPYEAIVILIIVVLNAVLGYVQESRAEEAVAALQKMASATVSVVRDGHEQRIDTLDLVPGAW